MINHGGLGNAVFKIRSETCQTEAQFCQNLYMIKKEPTQILSVRVHSPALILKTGNGLVQSGDKLLPEPMVT